MTAITSILIFAGHWVLSGDPWEGSMAGIDDVLERLLTDAEFAHRLARDPAGALAGYELTQDDLSLLSTQVSFDPGALSLVEERISKSSMFGLLTSLTGLGDVGTGQGPSPHMLPEPQMSPGVVAPIDSQGIVDPGDMDPDGARNGIDVGEYEEVAKTEAAAGGGGAGSEVSIKEVDPAPQPGAEALGTGGGGGAGSEVSFKEVEPGVPPDGDAQGIIIDTSVDNPDYQPAAAGDGSVRDPASLVGFNPQPDPPGVATPADGIIVQSG